MKCVCVFADTLQFIREAFISPGGEVQDHPTTGSSLERGKRIRVGALAKTTSLTALDKTAWKEGVLVEKSIASS